MQKRWWNMNDRKVTQAGSDGWSWGRNQSKTQEDSIQTEKRHQSANWWWHSVVGQGLGQIHSQRTATHWEKDRGHGQKPQKNAVQMARVLVKRFPASFKVRERQKWNQDCDVISIKLVGTGSKKASFWLAGMLLYYWWECNGSSTTHGGGQIVIICQHDKSTYPSWEFIPQRHAPVGNGA